MKYSYLSNKYIIPIFILFICLAFGFITYSMDVLKEGADGYNTPNARNYNLLTQSQKYALNQQAQNADANVPGSADRIKYDSNKFDIQYHNTIDDISKQNGVYDLSFGTMIVFDKYGNEIAIPYVPGQATPTYYQAGSFTYGASSYVPNYEDSVYLSRTTGMSSVGKIYPTTNMLGGFCNAAGASPDMIEQKCNQLTSDVCGSVSCCVLLGGNKCVSGNAQGPFMNANYSDPFVKNKDAYYYQGNCYGNCM